MSHTALARKYRPRSFSAVATQEHVSQTLKRAVASRRVGHAYLFCGPRGVGKTTLARVLAMALNCEDRAEDGEPCGRCSSCERIWSGHTSLDVVEIDAASNRGVEDARQLRERAMYAPSEERRHKVYIVDEAHMLTREAWNALLKVIEEPPPRVIFIFATTEPQKIEQTAAPILSRCQRFDFRRIGAADIAARLREVLGREGVDATEEALRSIARKADGGMRDALSITDQVLSMSGGAITQEGVARILGMVAEDRYLELFDLLAEQRRSHLFPFVGGLLDEGYDLVEFYHGLVEALRTLLRLHLEGGELPDLSDDARPAWEQRASRFGSGDLVRMLSLASELESTGSLRRSAQPRVLVELLLLRMSYLERTVDVEELIRALGGEGSSGPESDPSSTGARPPGPSTASETGRKPKGGAPASPVGSDARGEGAEEARDGEGGLGLREAWERVLGDRDGVPEGLGPFLRAAEVFEVEDGGTVVLRLPSGPGLDRLAEPSVRQRLQQAIGRRLGRRVPLEVRAADAAGPAAAERIDERTVRRDRLRDLLAREPALGPAVKELDLEILD